MRRLSRSVSAVPNTAATRAAEIRTDFFPRVAALIITAEESEADDKESGETRQFGRMYIPEDVQMIILQTDGDL